jgi:putative transposase
MLFEKKRPEDWLALVQQPRADAELEALRRSLERNRTFGSLAWQQRTAQRLGLEHPLRARGRPTRIVSEGCTPLRPKR